MTDRCFLILSFLDATDHTQDYWLAFNNLVMIILYHIFNFQKSTSIMSHSVFKWLEFSSQNGLDDLAMKCVDGVIADYAQDLMQSRNTNQLSRQAMVQILV